MTLLGAANRDPETYDRPGAFDIRHDGPADHLALSRCIQYFMGQLFARLEAIIDS